MERYEAYKDSGVDWIGEIPADWTVAPLKTLASIVAGQSPSNDDVVDEGSLPFLQGKAEFGSQHPYPVHYCDRPKKVANEGSILMSVRAPVGEINVADQAYGIGRGLCAIESKTIDSVFLRYALSVSDSVLKAFATGSTFEAVTAGQIGNLPVVVPNSELDSVIADYLDAKTAEVDALVAGCEREVGLLQEYREAVISEAVTKGLDPDAPMKDSGVEWIGDIPKHWDAGKLLRHARLESGHTPSRLHPEWWIAEECTIPWITTQDVHRFRDGRITSIDDTELHVSQIGLDNSSARWLPAGTVALSRTASVGFSIVLSEPMASSQDFADWVPDDSLDSYYLLYSLRSMKMVFKQLQMGSTHKTIYMPDIMKLAVAYPPVEEQREIVSYLDAKTAEIDSLIDVKQSMADKLREYRKSLISEAVTGKFKVPGVR